MILKAYRICIILIALLGIIVPVDYGILCLLAIFVMNILALNFYGDSAK